jgi:hypothetical protein
VAGLTVVQAPPVNVEVWLSHLESLG